MLVVKMLVVMWAENLMFGGRVSCGVGSVEGRTFDFLLVGSWQLMLMIVDGFHW